MEQNEEPKRVDLNQYGNSQPEQGTNKPAFEKITKAAITTAEWLEGEKKDDYTPAYLKVTFERKQDNGQIQEFYENFGGARLYGDGKWWLGNKSALGKLVALMNSTFDFDCNMSGIAAELPGKVVGVLTESITVQGENYDKISVKQFY